MLINFMYSTVVVISTTLAKRMKLLNGNAFLVRKNFVLCFNSMPAIPKVCSADHLPS